MSRNLWSPAISGPPSACAPRARVFYVKRQIAAIMHRPEEKIIVNVMDVEKQAGGCDCGLFAIAFATALANGKQPGISIEHLAVLATFVCAINFY